MWQENLFSNLLTVGVLGSLFIIVYCKIRNQTLYDIIREVRQGFTEPLESNE